MQNKVIIYWPLENTEYYENWQHSLDYLGCFMNITLQQAHQEDTDTLNWENRNCDGEMTQA